MLLIVQENALELISKEAIIYLAGAFIGIMLLYWLLSILLKRFSKNPKYLLPKGSFKKIAFPLFLVLFSFILRMSSLRQLLQMEDYAYWFKKASTLLFIFAMTWLVIVGLQIVKNIIMKNYDLDESDNLKARKVYTQFTILERIIIFLVVIVALGIALMSFKEIREIGISVFASAGVAGIIIGFSAQKMISTVLAGIQIALAQPIKLDDVVIVEGEWGRIEEITLTYVVVKIWDKRRLIVPTPYFIDQPFQNWTKSSADILGTVYLYTDYEVSFNALRDELNRILENTNLWDGEVSNIQITDTKPNHVEVRALVSAKDASTAWDLRVHVREKMVAFLQKNYPNSIARTRVQLHGQDNSTNGG